MSVLEGTIIRVVASMLFPDDVIMQNVFHIVLTTLVGDGEEEDITLDMVDYVSTILSNFDNQMSDELAGDEVKVYEYDSGDDDFDEIGTGALDISPNGVAEYMPHGVALVQNFFTVNPDVQGRKYYGGFTEASHVDGDWNPALIAAAVLAADDIVTTYTGAETGSSYQPGVWSPTNLNLFLYSGIVSTPTVIGYQRRRKPGVGI